MDPDFGDNIGGWQGRIAAVQTDEKGDALLDIEWDSLTLRQIPDASIERCEEDGFDWSVMGLRAHEVDLCEPRDTLADVAQVKEEISIQYRWHTSDEQDRRILEALGEAEPGNDLEAFQSWSNYLNKGLTFPFSAEVAESEAGGPLRPGDQVKVTGIQGAEDLYGVLVNVRTGHRKFVCPLCDLRPTDKNSPNYPLVDDYSVWFDNR